MSLNRYVRQLKPIQENKVDYVKVVQLRELTITPHYQQRGVFNPFYDIDIDVEKDIRPTVGKGEIKFQNVEQGQGELLKSYGRGKYFFQIVVDDKPTEYYINTTKSIVTGHFGMKTRKNPTASSDVNEFLSLYFLKYPKFTDAKTFIVDVSKLSGDTGILASGGVVTYEFLNDLLDKDVTAERDILIGYNNSIAVRKDLLSRNLVYRQLHWVPQAKPGGIKRNNPSDIVLELNDDTYIGYSNKISAGKDKTPKLNTGIWSAYQKLQDKTQIKNIEQMIDKSWNDATLRIKPNNKNAFRAIRRFNISREKFSELTSQKNFADLAKEFDKDKLRFYFEDMYYPFRNNLLSSFSKYLKNPVNMKYFINTIGFYTYDDPNQTPCPYKLLIGSEKGSTLKDVVSNDSHRQIFFGKDPKDFVAINTRYDNKSQSFNAGFVYAPLKLKVTFPVTLRTRLAGGWGGKNLYITSTGFKIQ